MRLLHITLACIGSLVLIVGCAKSEDGPETVKNTPPATQPTVVAVNPTTQPEPTASMMEIGPSPQRSLPQWFPPAILRLSNDKKGNLVVRLYSDDPKDVLTGKVTVNSYDIQMVLPNITDPADISKAECVFNSSSMERQKTDYGIFLNNGQDVLQPMNVKVNFLGQSPRVTVVIQGTFGEYHISDQNPNPAPTPVNVQGFLDAKVMMEK